jgi:hypothetical protein
MACLTHGGVGSRTWAFASDGGNEMMMDEMRLNGGFILSTKIGGKILDL